MFVVRAWMGYLKLMGGWCSLVFCLGLGFEVVIWGWKVLSVRIGFFQWLYKQMEVLKKRGDWELTLCFKRFLGESRLLTCLLFLMFYCSWDSPIDHKWLLILGSSYNRLLDSRILHLKSVNPISILKLLPHMQKLIFILQILLFMHSSKLYLVFDPFIHFLNTKCSFKPSPI